MKKEIIIHYIVQISYKFGNMAQKFLPGYRKRLDYEVIGFRYVRPPFILAGAADYSYPRLLIVNAPGLCQGRFLVFTNYLEEDSA
ncbi:hypothetical protein AB685_20470 [Bacillus sp. LL01]|nr:hypothetical protein AB685_20470 [Bacillus sp. LL01]